MRISRDEWAMRLAQVCAQRSTCLRRAVGCVLLNERGHVLSTGYNGVAAGMPHCNEMEMNPSMMFGGDASYPNACSGAKSPSGTNLDGCEAIHGEQNALLQCRDVYEIDTCYTTTAPCITCVKLLMNTSCRRIVFLEDYPHSEASRQLWQPREWIQHV